MKRCFKIVLSLALVLVLAGFLSGVVQAHSGHHSRRAKSIRMTAYTTNKEQISGTTDNTTINTAIPEVPVQVSDTTPVYASCYANGYCTGNNLCDVNGVCQNGGICNGAPCNASCYQDGTCLQDGSCDVNGVCQYGGICDGAPCHQETCPWDGGCIVDGVCQYGGSCYGIANQNAGSGGNYGHHGGGHHGGRHHR